MNSDQAQSGRKHLFHVWESQTHPQVPHLVYIENVEKAHQLNLVVTEDLKDLANLIKEPEVFSRIAQAATQLLVACYTPHKDTFIKQQQVTIDAKQDKFSQR